jgi:hypothetical protein
MRPVHCGCARRILLIAFVLLPWLLLPARVQAQASFPHDRHERLFPLCAGCHVMDAPGGPVLRPEATQCESCHDGTDYARVTFTPSAPRVSTLIFDHATHARAVTGEALTCSACHAPDDSARMTVHRTAAQQCVSCHTQGAVVHLTAPQCETCHVPLAASRLSAERILAFPLPDDHLSPDFVITHGANIAGVENRCATCHTRERCTTCHVNAARVPSIQAIPVAGKSVEVPRYTPTWPVPATHAQPDWLLSHATEAAAEGACVTCHVQEDCTSCHLPPAPQPIERLVPRAAAQAPGAGIPRAMPVSHAATTFATSHGAEAATGATTCAVCHERRFCSDCHDAPARTVFHPEDFVARHATAAYSRRLECSNCHDTRVFCRDCHAGQGLRAVGRLGPGFHDAQPLWLLRHGQAARQGLESCTTCHVQRDCMQCHSELGAFRISPHGAGFDAARARARNPLVCRACHLGDPGGGGP